MFVISLGIDSQAAVPASVRPAMAATKKRCRDEMEREDLGHAVVKLREIRRESRAVLSRTPLLAKWDRCLSKWHDNLYDIRDVSQGLTEALRDLACLNVFELETIAKELLSTASELLEKMAQTSSLIHDGVLDELVGEMLAFLDARGGPVHVSADEGDGLKSKFRIVVSQPEVPEYVDLLKIQRPNVVENTDHQRAEQSYREVFERARRAVEAQLRMCNSAFDDRQVTLLISHFLAGTNGVANAIAQLEGGEFDEANPTSAQTKEQVKVIVEKLSAKQYLALVPVAACEACLDLKRNWEVCRSCNSVLCADCFEDMVRHENLRGWADPGAIISVARLECRFCKSRNGGLDSRLVRHLSAAGTEFYQEACRKYGAMTAQQDASHEHRRNMAQFRSLGRSSDDMLYFSVKAAVVDLVGLRKPCCQREFADYDACCAVWCTECNSHFCALCLELTAGGHAGAHRHVMSCAQRPSEMDSIYMPLDIWKRRMAMLQHARCVEWLRTTALPEAVKERLMNDFPKPDEVP